MFFVGVNIAEHGDAWWQLARKPILFTIIFYNLRKFLKIPVGGINLS